jgi:hypothetical protein
VAALLAATAAWAQYPGQVSTTAKTVPELRSIAVVEWTGVEGKPTRSRIIPVAVLDQGELQDGGVYMARPTPLALDEGVEYQLEEDGKPIGLYDIRSAGEQQGSWVGYGPWKPLVKAKPKPPPQVAHIDEDDAPSDEPVLHRKHHAGDSSAGGTGNGGSGGNTGPAPDPDRPTLHRPDSGGGDGTAGGAGSGAGSGSGSGTGSGPGSSGGSSGSSTSSSTSDSNGPVLHRRDSSDNSGTSGSGNGGGTSGSSTNSTQTTDPDRPTLHKHTSDDDAASGTATDPDRPRLTKKAENDGEAQVSAISGYVDPNRPRLQRGMYAQGGDDAPPSLTGMPVEMQQVVAVADTQAIPEHPWNYSWANPDDEKKMQSALEEIARKELGMSQPAAAPAAPVKTATHRRTRAVPPPPPLPPPAPLLDEQFRVFELAYGSGATLVFSAHTDGEGSAEKFITLVAQPDLYGNPLVLLKSVTDAAHLDDTPRMRLVDAVDAMADNRGELLFELRGSTDRQFVLYRVLRGQVQKLFVSGSTPIVNN